jgi:competence ComEA-like helix-hairpin-helix protein
MEFSGIKKIRFFTVFPLTPAEKKVLGFLAVLTLLGLATLGFEKLGGRFPDDGLPSAMSRVPLRPPVYVSHGSAKYSKLSPVLDLNRADEDQLRWVPGVGPGTARQIVQYRKAHGDFQTLLDLQKVPGLGTKKYDKMVSRLKLGSSGPAVSAGSGDNP